MYGLRYQGPAGDEPEAESGNWLERILQAQQMMGQLDEGLGIEEKPDPVQFERATMPPAPPPPSGNRRLLEGGLDLGMLIAAIGANKKAREQGGPTMPIGGVPLIGRRRAAQDQERAAMEMGLGEHNRQIGMEETKYNAGQLDDWTQRRASRMNSMLPSILANVLKEGRGQPTSDFEQKLRLLQRSEPYKMAGPKERAEMESRLFGVDERSGGGRQSPEDAYRVAYERVRGSLDAKAKYGEGGGGGGKDITESDVQDSARQMVKLMYEDGYTVEEAEDWALKYLAGKQRVRKTLKTQGDISPSRRYQVRQDRIGVIDPVLQRKLEVYAQAIARNPERREFLRQRIIREHGIDPDGMLEESR